MATTLRELIAKVVFRADASQLKDFDLQIESAKRRLAEFDAMATKGLHLVVGETGGSRLIDLEANLAATSVAAKSTAKGVAGVGAAAKGAMPPAGALNASLGDLYRTFGGLGAAAVAYKAINFGKTVLEEADAVGDLAFRLGIGTDELQTWQAFVEQAGGSSEDLGGAVKTLAKNIAETAKTAKGPAAEGFKRLGISTESWGKTLPSTMDVLLAAGGALGDLESDTERLALAQEVLGEASLKLLPAFEGGADGAKKQLDALRDLAVIYDEDFIESAAAANDELDLFGRQMKGVAAKVLMDVLPALRGFVRWMTPMVKNVSDAVSQSNILTAALGVLGSVGLAKLIARFGGLTNVLKIAGKAFLRFILPALILDDIISFLKGEESVIGDIIDALFGVGAATAVVETLRGVFEDVWDTIKLVIGAIFGVGEAGDMSADQLEAAFFRATDHIGKFFDGLVGKAKSMWDEIVDLNKELGPKTVAEAAAIQRGDIQPRKLGENRDPRYQEGGELYGEGGRGIGKLGEQSRAAFKESFPMQTYQTNAERALALGGGPAVSQSKSTSVTVTDNSTITSNINGVDAKNVGPALRQTESNITGALARSKAQVLRQTVGSAKI